MEVSQILCLCLNQIRIGRWEHGMMKYTDGKLTVFLLWAIWNNAICLSHHDLWFLFLTWLSEERDFHASPGGCIFNVVMSLFLTLMGVRQRIYWIDATISYGSWVLSLDIMNDWHLFLFLFWGCIFGLSGSSRWSNIVLLFSNTITVAKKNKQYIPDLGLVLGFGCEMPRTGKIVCWRVCSVANFRAQNCCMQVGPDI